MTVTEVQWSELQRDPKTIAAMADVSDVRVRRRDGATLLLTREDRATSSQEGAVAAARALNYLLSHAPAQEIAEALLDEFPWLELLPHDSIAEFATDFVKAARIAADLEQWHVLGQTIREWKATATIYADPALLAKLTQPLDEDHGPASNPMER